MLGVIKVKRKMKVVSAFLLYRTISLDCTYPHLLLLLCSLKAELCRRSSTLDNHILDHTEDDKVPQPAKHIGSRLPRLSDIRDLERRGAAAGCLYLQRIAWGTDAKICPWLELALLE
jgi:hypothetical protein